MDNTEPIQHNTASTVPDPAATRGGTSWATVAWGLVCLTVAGLTLAYQLGGIRLDWAVAGPATLIGAGALLMLGGLLGLLRRDSGTE